jgi:mannose-1-phosphate guanylyltransferase
VETPGFAPRRFHVVPPKNQNVSEVFAREAKAASLACYIAAVAGTSFERCVVRPRNQQRRAGEAFGFSMIPHLFCVILAGGSGTRFWPASRKLRPKQLLAIGPGTESLIAETVRRVEPLCPPERILIATGAHLLSATRAALPWLPAESFLGEPAARNTAPCIAWATWEALERDPEALIAVLPSDQHVGDTPTFLKALELALETARAGKIVTIGIQPTRAETGYGYVEAGAELAPGVRDVARFVEKPDQARAREYLESGKHFWNAGMFFFRADVMRARVQEHLAAVAAGLDRVYAATDRGGATALEFEAFPSISIDYAVMEKASDLAVVAASFGWSDLGSWQSAWELGNKDAEQNVASADAILCDTHGSLVRDLRSEGGRRVIALVGVENLCVIETDDALLVISREHAQDVRKVVDALTKRGRADSL